MGVRFMPLEKMNVLDKTLNCILHWGSSSGDLEIVEYFFSAITSRSTDTER